MEEYFKIWFFNDHLLMFKKSKFKYSPLMHQYIAKEGFKEGIRYAAKILNENGHNKLAQKILSELENKN